MDQWGSVDRNKLRESDFDHRSLIISLYTKQINFLNIILIID